MKNKIYSLAYICVGLLTPWNVIGQCSGWEQLGAVGFSASASYYGYTNSIAIGKADTAFVVYEDAGNGDKATVMKYKGSAWVNVGNAGFTPGTASYTSIALDTSGVPYVAFNDAGNGNRISVMKFNGTSWINIGTPGFSISYAYYTSIAIDKSNNPYVVFEDYAHGYGASVMEYNGTSWVYLGSPSFTGSYAYYTSITIGPSGNPYISYEDGSNGYRASVMEYNGITWSYIGSPGFSSSNCYYNNIVVNSSGTPYVIYEDAGNGSKATVMTFNGTSWVPVGSAGFSPSSAYYESIALDASGKPYASFADGGNGYKCIVMKYNGTSWVDIGLPDFTPSGAYSTSLAINSTGTPLVLYEDGSVSDRASVMEQVSVNITSEPVSTSTCPGGNISFTTTAIGSVGVNYQWEVNTGAGFSNVVNGGVYSGATSSTLNITGASHSMNKYKYMCKVNGGCIVYSDTATLVVFTNPIVGATASPTADMCIGSSVTLTATGAASYSWSGGVTNGVAFTPASSGTYTVTGTDSNGCVNDFTIGVTVNALPTISASASPSATICTGNPITLNGSGGISYTWSDSVTNGVPFTPPASGTYYVTGENGSGCTNKDSIYIKVNPLPAIGASVTPSATLCKGSQVKLTGSGGMSYSWNKGVYNDVYFAPDSSGNYVVTGTDANGCSNNDTVPITVNNLPVITATASPSATVCKGKSVTLTASGAVSYSWSGGVTNGLPFTPAASGNYIVTGTDLNGCSKNDTMLITVNSLPVINISGNTSICKGSGTILTASGANSYAWNIGGTNDTIMPYPASTTTYSVTGTDAVTGCINTASVAVVVNNLPSISISSSPSASVCSGNQVTLSGNGAMTYSWSGGITNAKPFTPASSGKYTLTGTDANGCSDTLSVFVTVNPNPTVSATASPSPNVCKGSDVTLSGTGALGYTWNNGVTDGVAFKPASSGTYSVTGTDINGCTGTASIVLTVNNLPTITAAAIPASTICKGSSVTLNGSGGVTYSWTDGVTNGVAFIPAGNTVYVVTGTDANGCSNSATISIALNPLPNVSFKTLSFTDSLCKGSGSRIISGGTPFGGSYSGPWVSGNIFSPDSVGRFEIIYTYTDSLGCSDTAGHSVIVQVCTGVDEIANNAGIEIYPNPVTNALYIKFNQLPSSPSALTVFDVTGRVIYSVQESRSQTIIPINVSLLPAGVYLLKLNNNDNQNVFRFIKD